VPVLRTMLTQGVSPETRDVSVTAVTGVDAAPVRERDEALRGWARIDKARLRSRESEL
jgi:hypothetical protein